MQVFWQLFWVTTIWKLVEIITLISHKMRKVMMLDKRLHLKPNVKDVQGIQLCF